MPPTRRAERLWAARSPDTPRWHFRLMIRVRPAERDVLSLLYDNPALPPRLKARLLRKYRAEVWPGWAVQRAPDVARQIDVDCFVAELRSVDDPRRLQAALRRVNKLLDDPARAQAYARLAATAGPEPVWALELERVGDIASMMPSVRESMSGGGLEPLIGTE